MLNSRKTAVSSPREKAERKKSGGLGGRSLSHQQICDGLYRQEINAESFAKDIARFGFENNASSNTASFVRQAHRRIIKVCKTTIQMNSYS